MNEDSLYGMLSEGEFSIIVCEDISHEDCGRFIEIQGNKFMAHENRLQMFSDLTYIFCD